MGLLPATRCQGAPGFTCDLGKYLPSPASVPPSGTGVPWPCELRLLARAGADHSNPQGHLGSPAPLTHPREAATAGRAACALPRVNPFCPWGCPWAQLLRVVLGIKWDEGAQLLKPGRGCTGAGGGVRAGTPKWGRNQVPGLSLPTGYAAHIHPETPVSLTTALRGAVQRH